MRLLAVALVALAACYQPADAPCTVHCAPNDSCPGDQTCGADGYCHAPGDDTRCVGYAVAISLGGTGTGVVRSTPPGLDCDGTTGCTATFAAGTEVELVAAPGSGARLSTWTGACSGAGACRFTVAGDVTVGATFNQAARLAVTLDGARLGHGRVVSTPAGIDCPGTACAAAFDVDQSVVLTATADAGSRFGAWTACPAAAGAACTVSLTGDATTTVQFVRTPRITVDVVGTTDYAIASAPAGVTCSGTTCTGVFDQGTAVTITAADGVASRWKSWTGCGGATGPCAVTVDDADVALAATYRDLYVVDATLTGSGSGTLTATGLTCGGTACSGTYEATTTLTITAAPSAGSRFGGWTGCDAVTGTGGTQCQVTVGGARSVQATFVRQRQLTIDLAGSGTGAVTIAGIGTCTADCTRTVDQGPVALTATADAGSRTGGFTGACAAAGASCTATLTADGTVVATFVQQRTLTVTPAAQITVVTPAGPCVGPATCTTAVDAGAVIALTATTTTTLRGQQIRWSAGCLGSTCTVTVTADLAVSLALEGGHLIWGWHIGRTDPAYHEWVHAVAAAPAGDAFAFGDAYPGPALDVGGISLPMPALVPWAARYAPDGTVRWARAFSTTGLGTATAACATASGDLIVSGITAGSLSLDGFTVSDTGRDDGYVARLDGATGAAEWIVKVGGPVPTHPWANDGVLGLACDGEEVALMWNVIGPDYRVADGPAVTGAGDYVFGVSRLDAGGHHRWSRELFDLASGGYNKPTAIAAGGGGVFVVGEYSGGDPGHAGLVAPVQRPAGFALRLDAGTGAVSWGRALGIYTEQGAGDAIVWTHPAAATVEASGALVVGGWLEGTDGQRANLGTLATPQRVTLRGDGEMFLLRLAESTGAPLGVRALGSATPGTERVLGLTAIGGDLLVSGVFATPALDLGGATVVGAGASGQLDQFVARLAFAGPVRWADRIGPFSSAAAPQLAVLATGEVLVGTYYVGPLSFEGLVAPSSSPAYDGLVMLLGP